MDLQYTWNIFPILSLLLQDMPAKAVVEGGRLTIPNLVLGDADTYICSTPDAPSFTPDRASLLVIPGRLQYA